MTPFTFKNTSDRNRIKSLDEAFSKKISLHQTAAQKSTKQNFRLNGHIVDFFTNPNAAIR